MVVSIDGARFPARLVSVGEGRVTFQPATEDRPQETLAVDEIVRWSHPIQSRSRPQVLLADGTMLVAADDWSGRGALQLGDEALTVFTSTFEEVQLPRQHVAAAIVRPRLDPIANQQLTDELRGHDEKTDKLWLVGGDRLTGAVLRIVGGDWIVATDAGEVRLPATSVEAVAFNPQLVERVTAEGTMYAVGIADGSLVIVATVSGNASGLRLETVNGIDFMAGSMDDLVSLQVLGSPRVTYLADLQPADYRHVPYLDIAWPWRRDRNLLGGRLRSGGVDYLKGVAMHSASRLTFALDGSYRAFAADLALDAAADSRGSVVFRVFVARQQAWQEAFTSDVVRGGDSPQEILVDVTGAQAITLVVDYADRGDELDHANWLDARLVK